MFSTAEIAPGKPAPDIFLHATTDGARPARALIIEDSAPGMFWQKGADDRLRIERRQSLSSGHPERLAAPTADLVFSEMSALASLIGAQPRKWNVKGSLG